MRKNIKHIAIHSANVGMVLKQFANVAKQTSVSMNDLKRELLVVEHYILREQMRKELSKIIEFNNETDKTS